MKWARWQAQVVPLQLKRSIATILAQEIPSN